MKPSPEQQCPACHFQRIENVCGQGRRRIYQTEVGEFFRNIDCPIFVERKPAIGQVGTQVCPTCGKPLDEYVAPGPPTGMTVDYVLIPDDMATWEIPVNDTISINEVSLNLGVSANAEIVSERKIHTKRRGFKDIPKAKYRKPKEEI